MSEQIFNRWLLEKATKPIPFWKRIILWFRPEGTSIDSGVAVKFKEWGGCVYITNIRIYQP